MPGRTPSGVNCNTVPPFQKNLLDNVLNPLNETAGPLPIKSIDSKNINQTKVMQM